MKKKALLIDVQFSTGKNLATTQECQTLQNSNEKQDFHYWILRFGCFFWISRKQRLLVETLYVS